MKNRFVPGVVVAALVGITACSSTADNPLCCNEFKVGATVDVNVASTGPGRVAAQAVADVAGIASAAIDDLTTACRGIAQDLDAAQADQDAADANTDKNALMKAWCDLAVKQIGAFKGGVSLTVQVTPAVCEASISAKADCQAQCTGQVKCDLKANPPKCTGGTLEISCQGTCTANANVALTCEGSCSGSCNGSCTVQPGATVDCQGKCDGTCQGTLDSGGNCQGKCSGTCSVTAPSASCSGTCKGTCSAGCKATGGASVKCNGTCDADYQPISCTGGKLEGGCQADAKCEANCDASVQAKASCTPPSVDISFGAGGVEKLNQLVATLRTNLPIIFALKNRVDAMVDVVKTLSDNVSGFADIKVACLPDIANAAIQASTNVGVAATASANVTGAVTSNP